MSHPHPAIFIVLAGMLLTAPGFAAPPPGALKSEMIAEPVGLHAAVPRLSWIVSDPAAGARQTAWQVQAASTPESFDPPDLWDSGMVKSDQSHLVPYGGAPPASRQRVHWRVRTWDQDGRPSGWSIPSAFEMGLLDPADWAARWIKPARYSFVDSKLTAMWLEHAVLRTPGTTGADRDAEVIESLDILREARPLVVARKSFDIAETPGNARLYLAALGFARVRINGREVSDEWNTPAPTHYKIAARYKVFDVTGHLRQGTNTVAVELAAGKYNETPGNHVRPFGDRPVLKLQLEFLDGGRRVTLGTDESWQFQRDPRHPVVSFWAGDVWDASAADPDHNPGGSVLGTLLSAEDEPKRLLPMLIPPETTRENLRPAKQWQIADGVWVFDFGRTVCGRVQLDLPAADGRIYVVRYSDSLRNHYSSEYEKILTRPAYPGREVPESAVSLGLKRRGNILFRNVQGRSIYTAVPTEVFASPPAGAARFAPRSGMIPFRYIEIIGFDQEPAPGTVSANIAHTALERTGTFTSSDDNLNRIHEAVARTLLYNAHAFYYDNNGAEKGFWPHTYGMNLPHFAFNCDISAYTSHIIEEVDLFTREEGFTTTAISGRRGEKGAAKFGFLSDGDYHLKLPYLHYLYSGDGKPLASHADLADAFVREWWFAGRFPTPFRVDHYGDHTAYSANLGVHASAFLSPPTKGVKGSVNQNNIASELSCTIYASHLLDLAATLSDLKGDPDEAARRRAKRDETRQAIRSKYYRNPAYGYAVDCLSAQGPNAGMIFYQVAPAFEHPELVAAIRDDIKRWNNHLSTGSRLTYALFRVLSSNGFLDQAVEMLSTRRYPSFLSMLDYADTLSESWPMPDAPATTSHCQTEGYSEIGKWFWHDLQGIHPDLDNPGFKHFFLKPRFPAKLDSAAAEFHSPYGPVASTWKREGSSIRWNVTVPWNASATVSLPEFEPRRIRLNHQAVDSNTFTVPAGKHRIEIHHVGAVLRSSAADNGSSPDLRVVELKTDYRVNPLGIDSLPPNLSWRMEAGGRHGAAQTAYRIRAASSAETLMAGTLLWDSGLIESNASTQIAYRGPELQSGERVCWQVKIRDENGRMSNWSEPAWFEAGLPGEDDWRGAQWIACDRKMDEPEMAPREIMGPWIAASGEGRVDAFTVEFELPDVPVVSAMAWWGVAGRGVKPVVSIEGRVRPGIVRRAMRGNRGYADLSFQLAPGQLNVLRMDLDSASEQTRVCFGMRVVLADGREKVIGSGDGWRAIRSGAQDAAGVVVAGEYGVAPYGEARVFARRQLPPVWLRTTVAVRPDLARARLYLSALGHGDAAINGRPLGEDLLTPAQTDFEDHAIYLTHDVTALLREGDNALAVLLDPGWYDQVGGFGAVMSYGRPALRTLLRLDYADGRTEFAASGPGWEFKEGGLREANTFLGERMDYRLEHDEWKTPASGSGWQPVQIVRPDVPRLIANDFPPVRRLREIHPVNSWRVGEKTWLFDAGENIAGWIRLAFHEPEASTVRIRYSEMARDGRLWNVPESHWWVHGMAQNDGIISDGQPQVYETRFAYKGFRYFEISGLSREPAPGEVLVYQIGNDAPRTATFESSDPLLNRLFQNGIRSHYGNMINGLLDCPHREKCVWGGDLHASWALGFHAIDSASFYRHQVRLSYTGPTAPGGIPGNIMVGKRLTASSSSFNWSVSPLFITWWLHRHFGDLDTAGEFYGPMHNFLRYFDEHAKDGIPHLTALADHAPPFGIQREKPDNELISALNFFAAAQRFAAMARALDKAEDADWAEGIARKARAAVLRSYREEEKTFGNGTHDSLALAFGIFDDPLEQRRLAASLAGHYRKNGHRFDGGFMSYWIYPMLSRYGYGEDALKMMRNTECVGPAQAIVRHDATTFWEMHYPDIERQSQRSLNHHAANHPAAWLITDLAGMRLDEAVPGGRRLILAPFIPGPGSPDRVKASMRTPHGLVESAWMMEDGAFEWSFAVPANVTAEVRIPAPAGAEIHGAETMRLLRRDDGCALYEAVAGSYAVRSGPGRNR